jgi:hypothetical protein
LPKFPERVADGDRTWNGKIGIFRYVS